MAKKSKKNMTLKKAAGKVGDFTMTAIKLMVGMAVVLCLIIFFVIVNAIFDLGMIIQFLEFGTVAIVSTFYPRVTGIWK